MVVDLEVSRDCRWLSHDVSLKLQTPTKDRPIVDYNSHEKESSSKKTYPEKEILPSVSRDIRSQLWQAKRCQSTV